MTDRRKFESLRKQAERILKESATETSPATDKDLIHIIHEIEISHIELDLQNQELRRLSAELESSRNDYFELFNSAPVGFLTLNRKGVIDQVNLAAADMLQTSMEELIRTAFSRLIHSDDRKIYFDYLQEAAGSEAGNPCELRLSPGGGRLVYVQLQAKPVYAKGANQARCQIALSDITRRKETEETLRITKSMLEQRIETRTAELTASNLELKRRSEQLAMLTSELTLAEHRERRRLAQILHDQIQQLLVGAKINLEVLSLHVPQEQRDAVKSVLDLIAKSIQTSRSLTAELSPPILYERGLAAALEWLARWMKERFEFSVRLEIAPGAAIRQENMVILLFQAVRELLFNTVKHAGVNASHIQMDRDSDNLRIVVSDEGEGFSPERLWKNAEGSGYGLITIKERLELMGGRLEVESAPGSGARFTLIAPVREKEGVARALTRAHEGIPAENLPAPEGKIRVLLVDDHTVMRKGLLSLLSHYHDIEVVGEAENGLAAIEKARELNPRVILMDVNMPKMNGLEATRIIKSELPHIRIIGLSMYEESDMAAAMAKAGAFAYLPKSGRTDAILSAIYGGSQKE
jgi:PAS domain S-box-containing protein